MPEDRNRTSAGANSTDLALVMLSNFGRADGGRETWAYNFLPRLLETHPRLRVRVYGLRVDGEPDSTAPLLQAIGEPRSRRVRSHFFSAARNRVPNLFYMAVGMIRHRWSADGDTPALTLAVGSFVELLCVMLAPGLRRGPKIAWLRTIFVDEKAHRIPDWLRPVVRWFEKIILKRADLIVANGEDTARHYRRLGLSVTAIPNAVELERWKAAPATVGKSLDVAFVGRLAPVKGIHNFLDVAGLARERAGGRIRFHVIGEGPAEAEVRQAEARGLVEFRGPLPNAEMPDALKSIQACVALTFVRGSDRRGSGGSGVSNALLEQMAAGRIMVCWANDAFSQVLDDKNAYFVPQGDNRALLDALLSIVDDPSEAERRAVRAAQVGAGYGLAAHMDRFEAAASPWLASTGVTPGTAGRR